MVTPRSEAQRVKQRFGLTLDAYRTYKGNLKTERGVLADIVWMRKLLRQCQANIDEIDVEREKLLWERRDLIVKLRALGVQKSAMAHDIDKSFMVITQDLERAELEGRGVGTHADL